MSNIFIILHPNPNYAILFYKSKNRSNNTMELKDAIRKRSSVREYENKPVSENKILNVLKQLGSPLPELTVNIGNLSSFRTPKDVRNSPKHPAVKTMLPRLPSLLQL